MVVAPQWVRVPNRFGYPMGLGPRRVWVPIGFRSPSRSVPVQPHSLPLGPIPPPAPLCALSAPKYCHCMAFLPHRYGLGPGGRGGAHTAPYSPTAPHPIDPHCRSLPPSPLLPPHQTPRVGILPQTLPFPPTDPPSSLWGQNGDQGGEAPPKSPLNPPPLPPPAPCWGLQPHSSAGSPSPQWGVSVPSPPRSVTQTFSARGGPYKIGGEGGGR